MAYKRIDPTADCGIQVFGKDLKTLFENAGMALFDLIADIELVKPECELGVQIAGSDWADLMVNWLRELLYFWNVREILAKEIQLLEISQYQLRAIIRVQRFNPSQHRLNHEIKAVTYHRIQVTPSASGWEAMVVFDV